MCIGSWQQLSPGELALLVELMREEVMQGLEGVAFQNLTGNPKYGASFSPALAALSLKCVESAMQVTSIIRSFDSYNGPLPVPSFDAFVQAHKLLKRTLSEYPLVIIVVPRELRRFLLHLKMYCISFVNLVRYV